MEKKNETFAENSVGLAQPAIRALHGAGIYRLEELNGRREDEIAGLHGMGPKGMAALKTALRARGLDFARGPEE